MHVAIAAMWTGVPPAVARAHYRAHAADGDDVALRGVVTADAAVLWRIRHPRCVPAHARPRLDGGRNSG